MACTLHAFAWLSLLYCAPVFAFSQPSYYPRPAALGGGGGRWFTGAASDGYTCNVCHTGSRTWPMHVSGLPSSGYVPGTRYDVHITWPEFSSVATQLKATMHTTAAPAAPDPTTTMPGAERAGPDMSLLAELSTADGAAAGRLDMDYADIAAPERRHEWCEHLDGVPASQLFDTKAAAPDQPVLTCQATQPVQPGQTPQRCLLAVQVCGARTLRFAWTAPAQDVGPVWFSAGLVATERLSADPENDDVTIVAYPIYPSTSTGARYVETITHGCSVTRLRASSGYLPLLGCFVGCCWLPVRSRRRSKGDK